MSHQSDLNELQHALRHSLQRLWRSESLRARGRSIVIIMLATLIGIGGSELMRRLSPASIERRDREMDCIYAAQLAGDPAAVRPPLPVLADTHFSAQWLIVNSGTCPWNGGVTFRHVDGPIAEITTTLSAPIYASDNTPKPESILPGDLFAPTVGMTAPQQSGIYANTWQLYTPRNEPFGPRFAFTIQVYATAPSAEVTIPSPTFDMWFVIPALIGIVLAVIRSGQFVAHMYSLRSIGHGIEFVLAVTFGIGAGPTIVAANGEIEGTNPPPAPAKPISSPPPTPDNEAALLIGGPCTLNVKSSTAVVTERGGGFSRMLGPAEHRLMSFERVRAVIDLRTQFRSIDEVALTKDGVPVKASVFTFFKIMRCMPNEPAPPEPPPTLTNALRALRRRPPLPNTLGPLPASPEALRIATYEVHANPPTRIIWSDVAGRAVSGEVRDAMASRLLDQLFAPDDRDSHPRQDIGAQLFNNGKATLARRGIELTDSGFGNFQVPTEVTDQRHNTWQVLWEKESTITKSDGEAGGILQYEIAKAEAQVEFIQSVAQAIRTSTQTIEPSETAHPLSLRFMDVIAHAVNRTLSSASNRLMGEKEIKDLLDEIRKKPSDTKAK